jgi:aspartate/methionine/tyrosine aminotransferase
MKAPNEAIGAMPRSGIREIMDLTWGRTDVLRLEVGEPDFGTPEHVIEAAARAAADGQTGYTANQGTAVLREAIREKLARVNGIEATQEEVVVTVGAVNALLSALLVLVERGDGILLPDPGWPNYHAMATMVGADVIPYPLSAPTWEPDLDELERLCRQPNAKVLVINSPGNPTGGVWSSDTIDAVLELARANDLYVLSDEVYEEIVFAGEHVSPGSRDDDGRVITVSSASKTYAMTGWRIGYLATTESLAGVIAKVQESTVACPNSIAQAAAVAALCGPQDCVGAMRAAYRERCGLAVAALREEDLLVAEPRGAFYAFADVSAATRDTMAFARKLVADYGVSVAPGATFGANADGLVRLSLASSPEVIREGIGRLGRAVREWHDG